ncbi:MAG: adenylyl-sulfate kinase [Promethearchaeota archaeon]|nr:MAG: adenylyl-sulfate kinase [Candidatus Lokiarchaeota archaeon]
MIFKLNFLVCLAGLPSAGKSTLAHELKHEILEEDSGQRVEIIDPDIIRTKLTGDTFEPKKEKIVRKKNLEKITYSLEQGKIVISDDLNYYSSMRHELREIADKLNIPFFIIYVSTPLKSCLKWNKDRGSPIPNNVIYNINEKFDKFDKYDWDTPDFIINISEVENLTQKVNEILKIIKKRIKKFETDGNTTYSSEDFSHKIYNEKLDSLTREIVGRLLKDQELRRFKSKIITERKNFVKKYLNKSIPISQIPHKFETFLKKHLNIDI